MVPPWVRIFDSSEAGSPHQPVFHQPPETVLETDNVHAVQVTRGLAKRPDRGVESGAVTSGGQNSNAFFHNSLNPKLLN